MATKKLLIMTCLLLSIAFSNSAAISSSNGLAQGKGDRGFVFSDRDVVYESRVGWNLARCLIAGCSIFTGAVQEIVEPELQVKSADPTTPYLKVSVTVDEWLYGEPQQLERQVHLDKVPIEIRHGPALTSQGDVWRNVKLEVGKRLLVVFFPATPDGNEKRDSLSKVDRYGLVISDEKLFSSIRDTVANHIRYATKPEDLLDAPSLLNAHSDNVFSSYLVYYFRVKGGYENTDTEATVVSQLIGNSHVAEEHLRLLEGPLVLAMTNSDAPVSEVTHSQVTDRLIAAGCSENATLASSALRVLVSLSDSGNINIKPFLSETQRKKLIKNYKALISPDAVENKQARFESQLGLSSK
jgi:hypothetical protein